LKDDPDLIDAYKSSHRKENIRAEITESIKDAGVVDMQIYCTGNRLFMIMEVDRSFDFRRKAEMDANNPQVQDWEDFVSQFQQTLPWAEEGEKWVLMEQIYGLDSSEM